MSEIFVVSGKRFTLTENSPATAWKITRRPGGWCLAESPSGERIRFVAQESGGKLSVLIGGRLLRGELTSARAERMGGAAGASDGDLTAQFPGKVRKVLVQEGQVVKAGEPLILVEAMKMEFTIRAPVAGNVKGLRVKDGQQITPGDRFLDVIAAGAPGVGK